MRRVESDGVELVVTHHHRGRPRVGHGLGGANGQELLGATIDQVADEDRLASRVGEVATLVRVAHLLEQLLELGALAMHITNDVIARFVHVGHWLSVPGIVRSPAHISPSQDRRIPILRSRHV